MTGLFASIIGIAGFMTYRSFVPTNIAGAFDFFSSCWTCNLFSGIINTFSSLINISYKSLGPFIIDIIIIITAVWICYEILKSFISSKMPVKNSWEYITKFSPHLLKMAIISVLLLFPLPKFIISNTIEPIFAIGISYGNLMDKHFSPDNSKNSYQECLIGTIINWNESAEQSQNNAFSTKFRASLNCSLARIHKLTATGITTGWALTNEAFNTKYAYGIKNLPIIEKLPLFPNLGLLFGGIALIIIFIAILLPIPIYMIEVMIKMSMDFLFLPLILLEWLFDKIFTKANKTISGIINQFINGVAGIALLLIFISFGTIFLNTLFSPNNPQINYLQQAITQNRPDILVDGIYLQNSSFITLLFIGIFMVMFMFGMVKLIKTIFNVSISEKYLEITKSQIEYLTNVGKNLKKIFIDSKSQSSSAT